MEDKLITQLSIFVNNEPGRLAAVCRMIRESDIRVKAFNLAESAEFGILRAIVENPDEAYEKLRSRGVIIRKTDIIAVRVGEAADSFFEAVQVLGDAGVNIEYGYFNTGVAGSVMFVRVDDPVKAVGILEGAGIGLLDDPEI